MVFGNRRLRWMPVPPLAAMTERERAAVLRRFAPPWYARGTPERDGMTGNLFGGDDGQEKRP